MEPIKTITSHAVLLAAENVDTDQIIPARYLKVTDRAGLGEACFTDWRYDAAGKPRPDFPLNRPEARGARFLLAGDNFGCGSSREHAPWALKGAGFDAVISTSFADIFRNNSLKNGLLPVIVDAETHRALFAAVERNPYAQLSLDLETQTLRLPDGRSVTFPIDGFAKHCLLNGVDELGYMLAQVSAIEAYESRTADAVLTR